MQEATCPDNIWFANQVRWPLVIKVMVHLTLVPDYKQRMRDHRPAKHNTEYTGS